MDNTILYVILFFFVALGLTIPVALSLFAAGIVGLAFFAQAQMSFETQSMLLLEGFYKAMDNFSLVVVLFFVLCGNIMTAGSIVKKLINFAKALVGFFPGGLAMAGVVACGLFGAISGSTVATVVAIGGFMIPALVADGYDEHFSVGLMTSSPILGIIIPPSISMMLYAAVTNDSLAALFMTGYAPGALLIGSLCVYSYVVCKRRGMATRSLPSFKEFVSTLRDSIWAILLPVIIFVGIYTGIFTASEAAVIASVYAFVIELWVHKNMTLAIAKKVMVTSAVQSATLLIIVSGATVFGKYLTVERLPDMITDAVTANITNKWVFLGIVNLFLLVVGMFMDIISATIIITPILLPMLAKFGINTLHFGLLMTVNLGIGYITPPVGVSLYIAMTLAKKDLIYVVRSILPFLLLQIAVLAILVYWPDLSLFLPKIFYPAAVEAGYLLEGAAGGGM
ncbi:MAG: TRAP transporter large permease [Deltaproteobacteria bacterium]|nr:TRAP transporter large permease [Deltaproteobacteria bacterium]